VCVCDCACVCMYVCVSEGERDRQRECVFFLCVSAYVCACVCVCACLFAYRSMYIDEEQRSLALFIYHCITCLFSCSLALSLSRILALSLSCSLKRSLCAFVRTRAFSLCCSHSLMRSFSLVKFTNSTDQHKKTQTQICTHIRANMSAFAE